MSEKEYQSAVLEYADMVYRIAFHRCANREDAAGIALLFGTAGSVCAMRLGRINTREVAQYDSYEKYLAASAQDNPFPVTLPRELGFGFIYLHSNITDQFKQDEQDEMTEDRKKLTAVYGVSGNPAYLNYWGQSEVYVSITTLFEEQRKHYEEDKPASTREIEGVRVNYASKRVLCVGTDYELTAAQKKGVQRGEYFVQRSEIWNGSQERTYTSCYWMKDGVFYELIEYDTRLTEDEWYTMAETFLSAQ